MMKLILLTVSLLVLGCTADLKSDWEEYKATYGKIYSVAQTDQYRFQIWAATVKKIEVHNRRFKAGQVSYFLGLNRMSDMTDDEKKRYKSNKSENDLHPQYNFNSTLKELPASFDWRQKGAVNQVRDQGECGASWAFSTMASIESQYYLKTKKRIALSEQELIDCATVGRGCGPGGSVKYSYNYLMMYEMYTRQVYPYKGVAQKCQTVDESKNPLPKLADYVNLHEEDEDELQRAIVEIGPISVAIDASSPDFYNYAGGIFDFEECGNTRNLLDHAMVVVGFGSENGTDYYIVRNSWGTGWGEGGYIRMSRNKDNQCGIASDAKYPTFS